MKRNAYLENLKGNYLFPEIQKRKQKFLEENPTAKILSLGIGDTTEPLPLSVVEAIVAGSQKLGTKEGYSGYGPEQGGRQLREAIASKIYNGKVSPEDIFISDGAKCDIGRLQTLFGGDISVAVQDPAYPVYVDGSLIQGVKEIVYMPCTPENQFFPDLEKTPRTDLIYICSPNNPTGAPASREQLQKLIQFALKKRSIVIFDAAYANFIQSADGVKSIYEIEDADKVAIEVNSFSKLAGFTGVRLAWTVVPESIKYEDGRSVKNDWSRITSTVFNGASNVVQSGGLGVLSDHGWEQAKKVTAFYLENGALLKKAFQDLGYEVYGGVDAPYLWIKTKGMTSWDCFEHFLKTYHLVTTPGSGFGPAGEGFFRVTAFGKRESILEAIDRLHDEKILSSP